MNVLEKNLLSQIENIREELNCSIDLRTNTPLCSSKTHMLSRKLDQLIYLYMTQYK
ncbi:MAG: Spo0E family sporulation regulatory protein-aspartic acid phosphatase [Firmicutes bacterium]|jgi:hypothetical protein|nr:Spo0E family sporulation regulatory protein-aspartic acid phosphatase [Bacillota bacterium]